MSKTSDLASFSDHVMIQPICRHERLMIATFRNSAIINDQNLVRLLNSVEPMRDDQKRLSSDKFRDCCLNMALVIRVNTCCRLIQDYDGSVFQDAAGNRDPLLFTAGQAGSSLTDHSVETLRQGHDEIVAASFLRRLLDFLPSGVHSSDRDVVADRIPEEINPLKNHADVVHQLRKRDCTDIRSA